jgi:hypothetical protein
MSQFKILKIKTDKTVTLHVVFAEVNLGPLP